MKKIKLLTKLAGEKINKFLSLDKPFQRISTLNTDNSVLTKKRVSSTFNKKLKNSTNLISKLIKKMNLQKSKERLVSFVLKYKKLLFIITSLLIASLLMFLLFSKLVKPNNSNEGLVSKTTPNLEQNSRFENEIEATTIANIDTKIRTLTGDKDELFIITNSGKFFRLDITNNDLKEIPLKNEMTDVQILVSMPTLRLIFLISENSVFSYSPVMNRFTDVDIKLPNNLAIGGAGVYLQYLYLLDKNSKNIYQFPRKPGGFNNYRVRIADQEFFSTAIDLAVDDSLIVAAENGEIKQYFQGELKKSFSAKNNADLETKIVDIETGSGPNNLYALDSANGVLFKLSKNDQTKKTEYFNRKFIGAEHFWVNEKQDRVFVGTENKEIIRIAL